MIITGGAANLLEVHWLYVLWRNAFFEVAVLRVMLIVGERMTRGFNLV